MSFIYGVLIFFAGFMTATFTFALFCKPLSGMSADDLE